MRKRATPFSPAGARWWVVPVVVACCAGLLLGYLAASSSARTTPTVNSGTYPSLWTSRSVAPNQASYVVGQICLSTGEFLSDNQSCPDHGAPQDVEWDASNGDLLISNENGGGVWVVSPSTGVVLHTLSGGAEFDGAAVDSTDGDIYVPSGNVGGNFVEVYSGTSFASVGQIPVGQGPDAALFDPANGDVYVANAGSDNVSVIDSITNQVIANVPIGGGFAGPADLTLDSETGNLYVTGFFNNAIVVNVSSGRVVANVSLRSYGTGMVFDPENGELYVPNVGQDTLMAVNGTTNRIVANISIYTTYYSSGDDPVTAAFDPSTGNICVTNFFSPDISVVPGFGNSLMAAIPASDESWGIAFDPINGYGFASGFANDTVTVFTTPHTYPVSFVETGLASGVNWTVSTFVPSGLFYSVTKTTHQDSITIVEPNGTAILTVSANNYTATPERSVLNVTGEPLIVPIQFTAAPAPSTGSSGGISWIWWYGIAAAAVLLIAVAGVALTVRARRRKRDGD